MTLVCPLVSFSGKVETQIELDPAVFSAPFRLDIISRVVHWQRAKKQAGTHAVKEIADVSGTGKKPYKQKGTGRARHGSLRSPQFRGGAIIFGPQVRSHAHDLPKKIRRQGLKIVLSHKLEQKSLFICDSFDLSAPKSREVLNFVQNLELANVLFVGRQSSSDPLKRSIRNLEGIDFLPVEGLNVFDLAKSRFLILSQDCLGDIKERLVR
jgi:large subunit ribosomal protein L4